MPRSGQLSAMRTRVGRDSFNEAGAIMPRSGLSGVPPLPPSGGFNEAGAIMPRSGLALFFSLPN